MASLKGNTNYSIAFDRRFVFYDDDNNGVSPFWEQIRKTEISYGTDVLNRYSNRENIKDMLLRGQKQLKDMADEERKHEEKCLRAIDSNFPLGLSDIEYIKVFNETYRNKEEFKKVITRIYNAINEVKTMTEKERKQMRAPTMFSFFISYFNTSLRKNIKARLDSDFDKFLDEDPVLWDEIIEASIDDAFNRIEQAKPKNERDKAIYGTGKDYQDIIDGQGIADIMRHNIFFKDLLEEKLHISAVQNLVKQYVSENLKKRGSGIKKKRKVLKREQLEVVETVKVRNKKTGKLESHEKGLTGYLDEPVQAEISKAIQKSHPKNIRINVLGISNDINATDIATTIRQEVEIGLDENKVQQILTEAEEGYLQAMQGNSQRSIGDDINKWYNNLKGGKVLDDLFIVNTSNKLYSMGSTHTFTKENNKVENLREVLLHSFSQGSKGNSGVTAIAERMFRSTHSINDVVALIYNTVNGGFLSGSSDREKVSEIVRELFVVAAGNLLFSDYLQVGSLARRGTMVHLFAIDGVYIPLSFVLYGLADAFGSQDKNAAAYLSINSFVTTNGILYPKSRTKDRYDGQLVSEAFKTQRNDVMQKAKFTIHFVNNFKSIIQELAQQVI